MNKKWISLLTLIVFSIFTFACSSIRYANGEKIEQTSPKKSKRFKIMSVTKTTGEQIVFPEGRRGRILDSKIVGFGFIETKVKIKEIEQSNIKSIQDINDNSKVLITKDGQTIEFQISEEEKDKVILYKTFLEKKNVSIPLAEVIWLKFKKFNLGKTIWSIFSGLSMVHLVFIIMTLEAMFE